MAAKLHRSLTDKKIAGVAGGIAKYIDVDPVIVRVAFIALTVFNGVGLLMYIILWVIVPKENQVLAAENGIQFSEDANVNNKSESSLTNQKRKTESIFGYFLVILGIFFLMDNFIPGIDWGDYFPVIFIFIGIWLINNANKNKVKDEDDEY